ncbi:MAG: hypothetical protein AAFS10_04355, partial [Myxococcota bacterium]
PYMKFIPTILLALFGLTACWSSPEIPTTERSASHHRSPPIAHTVTAGPPPEPSVATTEPEPITAPDPSIPLIPERGSVDPNTTRFLVIGDSQVVGFFGRGMDYILRTGVPNAQVVTLGVCASNPMSWTTGQRHLCGRLLREEDFEPQRETQPKHKAGLITTAVYTPLMLDVLVRYQPDVLIIGLGENAKMAGRDYIRTASRRIMRHIECYRAGYTDVGACERADDATLTQASLWAPRRALSCAWALPPWTNREQSRQSLQRLMNYYDEGIGNTCVALDSRPLTCAAGVEGRTQTCKPEWGSVHFSERRGRIWAFASIEAVLDTFGLPPLDPAYRSDLILDWKLGL